MSDHDQKVQQVFDRITAIVDLDDHWERRETARDIVQITMPPNPSSQEERPLASFEGELIDLSIRYGCGAVQVCGRVRRVESGNGAPACLWVGEANVPVDSIVRRVSVGYEWVFNADKYNREFSN